MIKACVLKHGVPKVYKILLTMYYQVMVFFLSIIELEKIFATQFGEVLMYRLYGKWVNLLFPEH